MFCSTEAEGNVKCSAAVLQRTKLASDISSIYPWCLLHGGLSTFSTALTCHLLNKEIKKLLVIIAKYSHASVKILNTYSVEPSTDLIRGERVIFVDDYADHLAPFFKNTDRYVSYITIDDIV